MCGGGGRSPDPPEVREPQILRNRQIEKRLNFANYGIGALTMSPGDRLRFDSMGSVKTNTRPGEGFKAPRFGLNNVRRERRRRQEARAATTKARTKTRTGYANDPHGDIGGR